MGLIANDDGLTARNRTQSERAIDNIWDAGNVDRLSPDAAMLVLVVITGQLAAGGTWPITTRLAAIETLGVECVREAWAQKQSEGARKYKGSSLGDAEHN